MPTPIDPRKLAVLDALMKAGSFTGAADLLDYTQSAVSKQVASLEREVGATLVERGTRPVRLTEPGEVLARHARDIQARLQTARDDVEQVLGMRAGRLRVGAVASAARTFVADAIVQFKADEPGVELLLREGGPAELRRLVLAGEIDIAVVSMYPGFEPPPGPKFGSHHLLDEPDDVLLASSHPLARKRSIPIETLRGEDWLVPAVGEGHPARIRVAAACAEQGFEPRVVFEMNDCQGTQALVAAGMGIALMPRAAIHPAHPAVAIRELSTKLIPRRITAIHLEDRRSAALDRGIEILVAAAASWRRRGPREIAAIGHHVPTPNPA